MPHIVVEYSDNLASSANVILDAAYDKVAESGLFSLQAIKGRSVSYTHHRLPEGGQNFAHITVSILSGRTMDEKKALSQAIFQAAKAAEPQLDRLSVNIHDMEAESYTKA